MKGLFGGAAGDFDGVDDVRLGVGHGTVTEGDGDADGLVGGDAFGEFREGEAEGDDHVAFFVDITVPGGEGFVEAVVDAAGGGDVCPGLAVVGGDEDADAGGGDARFAEVDAVVEAELLEIEFAAFGLDGEFEEVAVGGVVFGGLADLRGGGESYCEEVAGDVGAFAGFVSGAGVGEDADFVGGGLVGAGVAVGGDFGEVADDDGAVGGVGRDVVGGADGGFVESPLGEVGSLCVRGEGEEGGDCCGGEECFGVFHGCCLGWFGFKARGREGGNVLRSILELCLIWNFGFSPQRHEGTKVFWGFTC